MLFFAAAAFPFALFPAVSVSFADVPGLAGQTFSALTPVPGVSSPGEASRDVSAPDLAAASGAPWTVFTAFDREVRSPAFGSPLDPPGDAGLSDPYPLFVPAASSGSGKGKRGTAVTSEDSRELGLRIVDMVNEERRARRLPPLVRNPLVAEAALTRAKELATVFSHNRPDGRDWSTILSELRVKTDAMGENIAMGHSDAAQVMSSWMNSKGHRSNILSSGYTMMGAGVFEADGTVFWVQIFVK
jgi:uncharacterized protein YkwD